MIPDEHIIPFRRSDEGELISATVVAEKEERIERHVEIPELLIITERDILGENPLSRPNNLYSILGIDSVSLRKKRSKWRRNRLPKSFFNQHQGVFSGGIMKLYIQKFKGDFTPHMNPLTVPDYLIRGLNQ